MKQIREKDKYSVIAYVWNLKIKQTNEYNSTETDSQITENKPVFPVCVGWGRGAGEVQTVGCKIGSGVYCATWNIAIIAVNGK